MINSTETNSTVVPILSWVIKTAFNSLFEANSIFQILHSTDQIRVGVNILFLATEIGSFIFNTYLLIRVCAFMHSMQLIKSHYRAIVFYNQYTYLIVGLCVHLSVVGMLSSVLIFASHLYLIYFVNRNLHQIQPKLESLLSCHYIPFLRDSLCNVYIYILLTLLVLCRRADIRCISRKTNFNQRRDLIERRRSARIVLLHSIPWVLSLGLSLPRGLLDMKYDFRGINPTILLEAPLSEELCLHRSNDSDVVRYFMWLLQAWMPLILCFGVGVAYSIKDKRKTHSHRNRYQSTTTLSGKNPDSNMYSSSRTLYSLHNYKEEVIKLVKNSPVAFYVILVFTFVLRFPFTFLSMIDNGYYLVHSMFLFNQLIIILFKGLEYLYLVLLPLILLHTIVMLVRNSLKINEIRQKVKKLAQNDEFLRNSIHRMNEETDNDDNDFDDSEKPFMLSTV